MYYYHFTINEGALRNLCVEISGFDESETYQQALRRLAKLRKVNSLKKDVEVLSGPMASKEA